MKTTSNRSALRAGVIFRLTKTRGGCNIATLKTEYRLGFGVERLNKESENRSGPATVDSERICKMSLGLKPEKAQTSDDLEPGELPSQQSPLDLRATGRGLRALLCSESGADRIF